MAVTEQHTIPEQESRVSPTVSGPPRADRLDLVYQGARLSLMVGFRVAAVLLAVGLILAIVRGESLSEETISIPDIPAALLDGETSAFIDLAILTLIVTPVFTSVVVALAFARIGDRLYMAVSLIVLAILSVSLILPAL